MIWAKFQSEGNPDWVLHFDSGRRSSFTLGRHPSCSLVLSDMHISSKHISISQKVSPEGLREVMVEDSSSNGTWVDGVRLERGVPVCLVHGSEVVLPCEDVDRKNYAFVFNIVADPNPNSPRNLAQPINETQANPSTNFSGSSYHVGEEQSKSAEQWQALEKVQEQLTSEASRLAASIYMNDAAVENLRKLTNEGAPEEDDDDEDDDHNHDHVQDHEDDAGTTIFNSPEDALLDLKTANENLTAVIEAMVGAMQTTRAILEDSLTISDEDRDVAIEAMHLDKFQEALDHLLMSQGAEGMHNHAHSVSHAKSHHRDAGSRHQPHHYENDKEEDGSSATSASETHLSFPEESEML